MAARGYTHALRSYTIDSANHQADLSMALAPISTPAEFLAAKRNEHISLSMLGDIAYNASSVHTEYFEAPCPMTLEYVQPYIGTLPGGVSALTAEIRITRSGGSEASAMFEDTAVSIYASQPKLTCDADTSTAFYNLEQGDKIRIKVVPTGTSGTIAAAAVKFRALLTIR